MTALYRHHLHVSNSPIDRRHNHAPCSIPAHAGHGSRCWPIDVTNTTQQFCMLLTNRFELCTPSHLHQVPTPTFCDIAAPLSPFSYTSQWALTQCNAVNRRTTHCHWGFCTPCVGRHPSTINLHDLCIIVVHNDHAHTAAHSLAAVTLRLPLRGPPLPWPRPFSGHLRANKALGRTMVSPQRRPGEGHGRALAIISDDVAMDIICSRCIWKLLSMRLSAA